MPKSHIHAVSEQDIRSVGAGPEGTNRRAMDLQMLKSWQKILHVLRVPLVRRQSDGSGVKDEGVEVESHNLSNHTTQSLPTISNQSWASTLPWEPIVAPLLKLAPISRERSLASPGFLLSEDDEYENPSGSTDFSPRLNSILNFHTNKRPIKKSSSQDSVISLDLSQADDSPSPVLSSSVDTWPQNAAKKFMQMKSQSAMDHYPPHRTTPSLWDMPRSKSTSDAHMPNRSKRFHSELLRTQSEHTEDKPATQIWNLYILDKKSSVIPCLFSVRDNHLIRATLALDETLTTNCIFQTNKSELLEKLLEELQNELTKPGNNMEELFHLLQELKVAARKHLVLRKLLWKESTLIEFMLRQLRYFLLNLQRHDPDEDILALREDELELAILILNVLSIGFRETEVVPSRWKLLASNKNKILREMVEVISSCPKVPIQYLNTTQRMLTSFKEFYDAGWENLPEAELIRLFAEVTNASVTLLFEILFACQQVTTQTTPFSGVAVVCDVLAMSQSLDSFWSLFLTQCLTLMVSDDKIALRPHQVVLLYQYLYVLNTVIDNNHKLNSTLKVGYKEEFRYYVHADLVSARIPSDYPIKGALMQLLQDFLSRLT